jgi:hypothetical protein
LTPVGAASARLRGTRSTQSSEPIHKLQRVRLTQLDGEIKRWTSRVLQPSMTHIASRQGREAEGSLVSSATELTRWARLYAAQQRERRGPHPRTEPSSVVPPTGSVKTRLLLW